MSPGPKSRGRNLQRRRRALRRGRAAEWLALWHLRLKGWSILARRWRSPQGEIDILARKGGVLAVVEVKARRDLETAAFSLATRQRGRILRAAQSFLQGRPELAGLDLRFDVILLAPWRPPLHIEGAWRADEPP